MTSNRDWMYTKRLLRNGAFNEEFRLYVHEFLEFAYTNATNIQRSIEEGVEVLEIRCPCRKCKNLYYNTRKLVEFHLCGKGFMEDYLLWYAHGECYQPQEIGQCSNPSNPEATLDNDYHTQDNDYPRYRQMIIESMHQPEAAYYQQAPQHPNPSAQSFFKMLNQVSEPLWEGSKKASTLSTTTKLLNWKSQFNASDSSYNVVLSIMKESLPPSEKLPNSFYETKKMLKPLQLPSQRITSCKNHCMLFSEYHSDLDHCVICMESRYKESSNNVPNLVTTYMPFGPRLQRLFYSKKTAQHMTWHSDHPVDKDKMIHPSEGRAWKHFDQVFPDFAQETRNVRLGLCTDGFNPNSSSGSPYSCWPVFLTVYNLPPWLAFKHEYILLPLIIPGPKSPGQNLDVFLQPLVHELKMLFTDGIETYDAHRMDNFQMRAVLLWTISDFPAYAMLSGWSTHGRLACPYCLGETESFWLEKGNKHCWFDCHRKHLRKGHAFKKDKVSFKKNETVRREIDIPYPTGDEIWETVQHIPTVYQGTPHGPNYKKPPGFGETHNWVKRSIFWELPYWRQLCRKWNTDSWKNKSKSGKKNRTKADSSGSIARHTGGSIGYEEHRLRLKELTGEEPAYMDVFCKMNLTKESKKKYFEGNKEDPLEFASGTAREAAEAYNRGLFEKYGDDPAQHIVNDPELWSQTQLRRQGGKQKGPMYGIGSSDLHFVVTGTYSTGSCASSSAEYAKSQEKVNELQQQVSSMQQVMDERQSATDLQMEQMKQEMALKMKEQLEAFMRQFQPPGNPPQ